MFKRDVRMTSKRGSPRDSKRP